VQDTEGAELHEDLRLPAGAVLFSKGMGKGDEGYSAFEGRAPDGRTLLEHIRAHGVETLWIGGLTAEHCVRSTAVDAMDQGLKVVLLLDAVRGLDEEPGDTLRALAELHEAGAAVCTTDELIRSLAEPYTDVARLARQVPLLDLPTVEGGPPPWSSIWQRRNLLMLVGDDACPGCLRVLEQWSPHLGEESAAAVAVLPKKPQMEVPANVSVLLDPDFRMATALGVEPGTAVAADRYFEIQARLPVHEMGSERVARETLSWLDLAQMRCDECGAPTW
jgi:hypothetical protein